MTLYFPGTPVGDSPNTPIYINGDFSGFNSYRLQLTSKYTNRDISADEVYEWTLSLSLLSSNERYTSFDLDPWIGQGSNIQDTFKSGYYDFTLYGSLFEIDINDTWEPLDWNSLLEGEVKVKTKTTHNMQISQQAETVKYTTEPNTAKSYVIYNQ